LLVVARRTRRRVTLRESFRRAYRGGLGGPAFDGSADEGLAMGCVAAPAAAIWYWIVGEPVDRSDDADQDHLGD
jgi:hypothetical protein